MAETIVVERSKGEKALDVAKVAGVLVGTFIVVKTVKDLFGSTGRGTERVPFNKANTQFLFVNLGGSPPKFHKIKDPWTPVELADELHEVMEGIAQGGDQIAPGYGWDPYPREVAWQKLMALSKDRFRWLHNYWLDEIDSGTTLFQWIKAEIVMAPFSDEDYLQEAVLARMRDFGIGF